MNHPKGNMNNKNTITNRETPDLFTKVWIHLRESYISVEELPRKSGLFQPLFSLYYFNLFPRGGEVGVFTNFSRLTTGMEAHHATPLSSRRLHLQE